ncbi:desmoplakin isoform X2 [Fundulus heteroclitus]|uniref:desmoplakin isoform X2 n=1 Tax=Fundulus heteroclitus TaxID=8078 RepID=UPI00165ABE76|nr:desmoplakin isoform X2 [Fundulus heteroclitus]
MNAFGSQHGLNSGQRVGSRSDLVGGGTFHYARSDVASGGPGNGHAFGEGFRSKTLITKSVKGGGRMSSTLGSASMSGASYAMNVTNKAKQQQGLCQEYLMKAEQSLQAGSGDSEYFLGMARDALERLNTSAVEMGQLGLSNDNALRSVDLLNGHLKELYGAMSNTMGRRKSTRKSSGGGEERARILMNEALAWIATQKRMIETTIWADDPSAIQQQLINHQRLHASIQGAPEVLRAIDELKRSNDKPNQYTLEQEWDSLKKMSNLRTDQLRELSEIVNNICDEIMWVNDREEQELMFDWGDKNIEEYIPKKQESYSRLMKDLEEKEKELHKIGATTKALLKNNHPASDKIEAYMETLQTQWSWLLQITKCIDTHLKENAAYSQFFKETNATMKALHEEHELIRKSFVCNKNTSLDDLKELLKGLEREKEKLMDHKRQVQHLTAKSKSIVRLKPRNPEEKGCSGILVKALTDYKQDQKAILTGNEAILKDNSQRSKWKVIGPGGLDMLIPSVCLIIPPPNPLCISLAAKNEQYYEAIMSIWHQLYINVKSLIAWQYCLMDIKYINSLTISMLSKMRPEEYRQILRKLEAHYEDFKVSSHDSEMIADEDKRNMEDQVNGAHNHYNKLVVELPTHVSHQEQTEVQQVSEQHVQVSEQQVQQHMYIIQQQPQQHHQVLLLQQNPQQQQLLLLQQQQQQEQQRLLLLQQQEQEQQRLLLLQQQQQEQEQQRLLLLQQQQQEQEQQRLLLLQQQQEQEKQRQQAVAEEEARRMEEERRQAELRKQAKKEMAEREHTIKKEVVKVTKTEQKRKVSSSSSSALSSSHLLSELHALRLRMDAAEGLLGQYVHICFGEDGAQDCGLKITQIETVQDDIDLMRDEYLRIRERILKESENMSDVDKAQFLRSEVGVINQRLGTLESSASAYVLRLRALRDMLESIARAEDIVKVHEARLTEKETTSLSPAEVSEYMETLKNMRAELVQKRDILTSMESELTKANHWNSQMGGSFHRCDLMLSKFSEQVGMLSDRWRRIQAQIDTRLQDLQQYLPQLQHYKQTSTSIIEWIDATRRKQDALQATKIETVQALNDHINNQKALNMEIKAKRETVESVLKDNEACVNTIKDYETDLNSYTSGLETLLSIPIKRTMLKSPSMELNQEAIHLQTRYMELLTLSGDYYKFLGESLKNMEQLKIRNTRIDLLEEELRRLKDDMQERNDQNKSLEDAVAQFKLQLSRSQEQLLSLEEVKQTTALQCSATKDSLDSTQSQLTDLKNEVERLKYLLGEEKRKTKLAEERYTQQQEEYDSVLRKRQQELETVSWSKVEVEKSLTNKEHEIEKLRQQLAEESARFMEQQKEMSKTRITIQSLQSKYNEIVSERDSLLQKLQRLELDKEQMQRQEEELNRLKLSLESEFRNKQRLQEENERVKRDLSYWKDQCDGKQSLIRQYDTDKDILEREKKSLKSEIEKLMKELRELEEKYKSRLVLLQKQLQDMTVVRQTMETEIKQTREPPTPDTAVVFDGVRKPVTAKQLLECGILDKPTYNQLVKGHKTIPEVSSEKKVPLKGTGPIAGVIIESPRSPGSNKKPICKLTFTEAKKENLLPLDSIDLLLDAQAATGHIIDPRTNQKLTVEEAYNQGVVDEEDRERLLAAEAAAVGYSGPGSNKPLSVFQAMKKGLTDKTTTLRLLQAQESVGGILDPILSVFLPRDTATERDLINDDICYALSQRPEVYLDPETEKGVTYMAMKRRCKIEPHTGLLLLPIPEKVDPSNLVFDGVRKPVTAKHLLDCGVLDKQTFKDLENGKKTVPEVSVDKNINLKGTGPIAGVLVGGRRKMSLTEAKKQMLLPDECADLLLEAQAATGHIIDPKANKKLTVEEASAKGLVDSNDLDRLLASEAAAIGYKDPSTPKPISVFQAMKKGLIDNENGLRLLQAQESVGGILDPILSVFLPRDTAIKRKLLDENLCQALNQSPECYIDPETEQHISYQALKESCKIEPHTGLLLLPINEKLDPSKLIFDGVRKPVTAKQLFDCGVLDKPTYNKLIKGDKTVPEVSLEKKIFLKGTGSIAGVTVGSLGKMSLSQAKTQMLMPPESADVLLEAQAATGHIIDPMSNQKLTVDEACARRVVDRCDRDRLLAAEAAAVGYKDPHTGQPLSVFEAVKKGLIDKKTGVRLLQAQESAGGILDPNLSVFLPKDTAIKRNLLDQDLCRVLSQNPECYLDPDTERDASYGALKKKCKNEPHTGLPFLPLADRKDPSKLMFDGVRKPVSAQQLLDCGVLDKPTFNKLIKGEKTVPEVSVDKKIFLKGTGSIAGVTVGSLGKMSLSNAKKQMLMPSESADLLLEAQAATGHIIDPMANQKLTVEEACARRVVDKSDQDKLLAAEAAAVGYKDPHTGQSLSVFEGIKKGLIDKKTGVRLLQAQESAGGILDPNLSVFLPKDTALKRNLLDEDLYRALSQNPECYLDPDTERDASYGAIKKKCKTEPQTGLALLPLADRKDPSKLIFDGVRKPVSAQELLDCGVLDKPTFNKLIKGEKTVPEVSVDKKIFLKGTGSIAGVTVGSQGKMSLSNAKKQMLMPSESADLLLEAQAATGHIIDPMSNQKLTVEEACARGVVDKSDQDKLLAAEAAAVGYKDPHTGQSLSVFEAVKKGLIDKKTGVRLLQAQESAGGILDPNLSVFLPKETALKRNLLDEDLYRVLNQNPNCYLDPDTERDASYGALKKKCKNEPHTGLALLPLADRKDPSKLMFDGVRKPVSAQQLLDCGVLDKPTFNKLIRGEKTVPEVSVDKKIFLKGTGSIAGVTVGSLGKMSLSNAKKQMLMPSESADLLLEAQAATGHIIDPMANQKLTVEEACARRVVDKSDQDKLLAAEAAAVGYKDPHTGQSLSVFEGIKKGLIDKKTGVRLLQAQESAGGILDPNLSVFLPKETALKRNLLDEDLYRALSQNPECYLDPDTERDASYGAIKKKCKTEPQTGLALLPLADRKDPSKLIFDGVRKPVSAQELLDCGVLDKPTFNKLIKGEKTVPEVSVDKKIFLKGTGSIAGVTVGSQGKMSLSNAKKQMLMPAASAYLLLEAQAATGHIIDPMSNQKLTVEEACARGVVDKSDQDKLLAAEAAAVGYKDPHTGQTLSVFEAVKQGLIDKKTGVRLLQAQESAGGILDPNLSVFLPKETALKRNLLDEDLYRVLNQNPNCYLDPDTERDASYGALKKKCKNEPHTGLALLPLADRKDPSKLMFDGVRKPVSAQQLLDCGVLDKPTFNKLIKGEKTVAEVSVDKKVFLKGTGSIAGVTGGSRGKISLSNAKKQMLMPPESADLLLEAQAATGKIIDPMSNQKLTVEEACAKGVVDRSDRDKLLAAEAAAIGYRDPNTGQSLSVFEAIKKGLIDKKTGVRLLQAQESAGGILDPNLSVFLPKETALKRNLLDEDLLRALNQNPNCYLDPDTERDISYGSLKKRCKIEPHTALVLLPFTERNDPSKLIFDGVRKPVSAQQLLECGVIDQATFNKLIKGEKTVSEVSVDKKVYLKGTGPIGGVLAGRQGKISFSEAKKQKIISEDSADLLLEAQAATGHIIDPKTEQKFTVEVACIKGVVDFKDQSRLLAAESAAVGYKDPSSGKIISLFEAMKKGIINEKTGLRLLQAQDSVGGILDPNLSVFLPKDTAIKRNLLDEKLINALKQNPACYLNPETEDNASYGALKAKCNTNTHTSLHIFPVSEKCDPSKILFDGVHKTVTAQQLLDCGVLDKETFDQLMKGKKTVSEVSVDIKIFLKGTGPIAGVAAGSVEKMSFTEAKKQKIMSSDSANKLLLAQAATGHIIDPRTNKKLTVKEAFARGLVDKEDESMLFAAEAAAIGYRDPDTGKVLSAAQAMRKGIIDKDTALSLLQAQESVGGILDPSLSVFLPKDIARKRGLIDEDLYQALNQSPECYLDPDTQQPTPYISLKKKCKSDPSTGLLLLPKPKQSLTIRGLRNEVSVKDLVNANLLTRSDVDQLNAGKLTSQDIENRLRSYLGGSTCIAGVYDEASDKVMSIYQAMDNNLLRRGTTLELLEAQAASGFMIDPINNLFLTVAEAYNRRLFGPEFKEKLLSAEKAVTGYKMPGTDKIISLFQAIENNLVEKGHGIRLLEAQIASGGIIDPQHSHRIDVNVAYKRGYFNEEMNKILTDESDDTKGFFDPNTEENLTYLELKKRCIIDKKTGLVLLPIIDKNKQESSQKNTVRKRRVIIVDPETGKEMTVREAYQKGYIDRDTYLELSEQECEWEEITITAPDGSIRLVIIDRSTGRQYDINDLLENQIIDQSILEQYRSHSITLTQFADIISNKTAHDSASLSSSKLIPEPSGKSSVTSSSMTSTSRTSTSLNSSSGTLSTSIISENSTPASFQSSFSSSSSSAGVSRPLSPTFTKTTTTKTTTIIERGFSSSTVAEDLSDSQRRLSSVSITLSPPLQAVGEVEPVGAIFDTEVLEKISVTEALNRGLVDSITAQRLLEAQACTGGIVNPTNGKRLSIQEASRVGLIANDMVTKLKPAQKAYFGFEDIKINRKLSAAQAMKEMWLPYEAGQRFLEFQVATGGLYDPEKGCRRSIEDALTMGWLDVRAAQKLQDIKLHTKILTCPKSKLRISYKEALDNCLVEDGTGVKMLQASSVSSRGISSPYNVASAPGSKTGSRSGSQRGSRRSSLDLGSSLTPHSFSSFTSFSSTK